MATHRVLPASNVKSLAWHGDTLVDMAAGGKIYGLDGSARKVSFMTSFSFDAAILSGDGVYAILYKRFGTKAVIFHEGVLIREINRSYYFSEMFDYPVCLWTDSQNRTLIAHCPDDYNRIEIEDAKSGERLTDSKDRSPSDFFHSRFEVSPNGKRLLSAGWVWHPLDVLRILDLQRALSDPHHLDNKDDGTVWLYEDYLAECHSACWQDNDTLLLAVEIDQGEYVEFTGQSPQDVSLLRLVRYDASDRKILSSIDMAEPLGSLMPVGLSHVVAFYDHPRLIELASGKVVEEWPQLYSGRQAGCIVDADAAPTPPMALDPANARFAILSGTDIHVIGF